MNAHPKSIVFTGAEVSDIVEGLEPVNRGMRLRLKQEQVKGNSAQLIGRFQLLEEGQGEYASYLTEFVGETHSAKDFIELLLERINRNKKKPLKILHIFNTNMVGIVRPKDPDSFSK